MTSAVFNNYNLCTHVLTFLEPRDLASAFKTNSSLRRLAKTPEAAMRVFGVMLRTVNHPNLRDFGRFAEQRIGNPFLRNLVLVKEMPAIKSLTLSLVNTSVLISGLSKIPHISQLTSFDLTCTTPYDPNDYHNLGDYPNPGLNASDPMTIISLCPQLRQLHLRGNNKELTDESFSTLAKLPLEEFTLCSHSMRITSNIATILVSIKTLRAVDLSDCPNIERSAIALLLMQLPALRSLGLGGWTGQQNFVLGAVRDCGQKLTALNLERNNDACLAVRDMINACPELRLLNVEKSRFATRWKEEDRKAGMLVHRSDVVDKLAKERPNLQIKGLKKD